MGDTLFVGEAVSGPGAARGTWHSALRATHILGCRFTQPQNRDGARTWGPMAAAVVPSHALVNFARLMRSCDDLAADLREEQRRHRLRAYLPVLQALWRELETSAECSWVELDEYGRKVERLVELLDEEKLARGGALAGTRVNSNARLTRKQANEELSSRLTATTRIHEALRAQLMHSMEPAPVPATTSSARAFAPTPQPPVVSAAVAVAGSVCSSTLEALLARAVAEREAAEAVAAPTGGETSCGATPAGSGGHAVGGAAESRVAGGAGSGPREGGGSMGGGPPVREASAAMTAGSGSAERQPRSGRGGGEAIAAQSVEATLDVERKMQVTGCRGRPRPKQQDPLDPVG